MASAITYMEGHKPDLLYIKGYSESTQDDELTVTDETRQALEDFFYGDRGLKAELEVAIKRLEEGNKPFFKRPLRIFDIPDQKSASSLVIEDDETTSTQRAQIKKMIQEELKEMGLKV